jgi:hypothetical protein
MGQKYLRFAEENAIFVPIFARITAFSGQKSKPCLTNDLRRAGENQ